MPEAFRLLRGALLPFSLLLVLGAAGCDQSAPLAPPRAEPRGANQPLEITPDLRARLDALRASLDAAAALADEKGLAVRLAFELDADLDLFVTDPLQESVYFANTPTLTGGTLEQDQRCDDPAPRIERVHYALPMAGVYRVGVDFPRSCFEDESLLDPQVTAPYAVRVDEGGRTLEAEGVLERGVFEVIVLEFEVERGRAAGADPASLRGIDWAASTPRAPLPIGAGTRHDRADGSSALARSTSSPALSPRPARSSP